MPNHHRSSRQFKLYSIRVLDKSGNRIPDDSAKKSERKEIRKKKKRKANELEEAPVNETPSSKEKKRKPDIPNGGEHRRTVCQSVCDNNSSSSHASYQSEKINDDGCLRSESHAPHSKKNKKNKKRVKDTAAIGDSSPSITDATSAADKHGMGEVRS